MHWNVASVHQNCRLHQSVKSGTKWESNGRSPWYCSHPLLNTPAPSLYRNRVKKVKWSHYRPGVAQRVGRGIAVLFHDRCTRRGWVVSSTPRPHFTTGEDPVPLFQEAGWVPGPVWTGGKSHPRRDSIPDRQARSQSLYRLSYRAYTQAQSISLKSSLLAAVKHRWTTNSNLWQQLILY